LATGRNVLAQKEKEETGESKKNCFRKPAKAKMKNFSLSQCMKAGGSSLRILFQISKKPGPHNLQQSGIVWLYFYRCSKNRVAVLKCNTDDLQSSTFPKSGITSPVQPDCRALWIHIHSFGSERSWILARYPLHQAED